MSLSQASPSDSQFHHLPRLKPIFYQGDAVVHWEMTIADRGTGWLTDSYHSRFRELLVHVCHRHHLVCPAYCLMPDHMHLVWMGLRHESDQRNAISFFRTHLSRILRPWELQHQAYDRVMRDEERKQNAFALTCSYILANPVARKLVGKAEEWRFSGAMVPGFPDWSPFESMFWERFWRLYWKTKDPGSRLRRPQDRLPEGKKPGCEGEQEPSKAA